MTKDKLIYEISHCEEFTKASNDTTHTCHKIVASQKQYFDSIEQYHVPEPWNGDIEKAQILFISSNPSIDPHEQYPTLDSQVGADFYENRFANTPRTQYSKYWKTIEKWSSLILNKTGNNILQDHIAITELVHCKSVREQGVKECCMFCVDKWLDKVLSLFHGQYIVLVGKTNAWQYKYRVEQLSNGIPVILSYAPSPIKGVTDKDKEQFILEQVNSLNKNK